MSELLSGIGGLRTLCGLCIPMKSQLVLQPVNDAAEIQVLLHQLIDGVLHLLCTSAALFLILLDFGLELLQIRSATLAKVLLRFPILKSAFLHNERQIYLSARQASLHADREH